MNVHLRRLLSSQAPAATVLIRVLVGAVFLSEGIQKFLDPELRGAGRFLEIGIPAPEILGGFVGGTEVLCGLLVLAGLVTRAAVVPLIVIMLVAIGTTKLAILGSDGFWSAAHASRTDFSMLLGSVFLLLVGAGPWSADQKLLERGAP